MLTTTAAFDALKLQADLKRRFILKIEADTPSTDFYFSSDEFEILDDSTLVTVYGMVSSWGTIEHGVNLYNKKLKVGSVTIQLINAPMKHTGTIEARTIYHLSAASFVGRTATIYAYFPGIADINTDGLKLFKGIVQPPSKVDSQNLTIILQDSSAADHKKIPADIYITDFPTDVSDRNQNVERPYPIVYGIKAMDDEMHGSLYQVMWIEEDKLIVSDVPSNAIDRVWLWDSGLDRFVEIDSSDYTVTLDDGGRTTILITDEYDVDLWAYFFPKYVRQIGSGNIHDLDDAAELLKTGDQDPSTILIVRTSISGQSDGCNLSPQRKIGDGFGDIIAGAGNAYIGVKTDFNAAAAGEFSVAWFAFAEAGDVGDHVDILSLSSPNSYTEVDNGAILNADMTWQDLAEDFYFQGAFVCGAAGASAEAFEIGQLRLRIKMNLHLDYANHEVFVTADGRKFGSWIDAGGRTPPAGQDDEGDIIQNPASVIEDILRTDLDIATADINTASFDAAANELNGWEFAFNLLEQINSLTLIENLCKQAMLNYYINSQGQHSLIVIKSSYSTDDTLYKKDIEAHTFYYKKSKVADLINDLDLQYDPHPATGVMIESIQETDSTSQTTYNIVKEKILSADKIVDVKTADNLADAMCSTASGFWNDTHYIIYVKMLTWEKIHWDIGDIILIDSSIDDIVRKALSSWENTQCMIIGKRLINKVIEYIMIDVDVTGGP